MLRAEVLALLVDGLWLRLALKLLLNLLSSSQGIAAPLRCLAIMDQTFNESLSPLVTKSKILSSKKYEIITITFFKSTFQKKLFKL